MPSCNWPRESCVAEQPDAYGRVVVHSLEYTITYQCVNRCRGCNHFTFIQPKHMISVEQFRKDIDTVTGFAHADKFSLIGGECLLHPRITELLDIVNSAKIGDVVSLTTNGQLINKFGDELWSRLQRIEFGLYAGKGWSPITLGNLMDKVEANGLPSFFGLVGAHPQSVKAFVQNRVERHGKGWHYAINPGFHPTLSKDVAGEEEAQRRFARCLYGHVCVTIDQGFLYRCPESSFVPRLLLECDPNIDGVKIEGMDAKKFRAFVSKEDHLNSCHHCCSLENYFPWSEVPPETTREEWLELAMGEC